MAASLPFTLVLALATSLACFESGKGDDDDDDDGDGGADDTGVEDGGVDDGGASDGGGEGDGGTEDGGGEGDGGWPSDGGSSGDGGSGGDGGGGPGDGGGDGGGGPGDGGGDGGSSAIPDELLVYYGWLSAFKIDNSGSEPSGTGEELFFYYEDDEYGEIICATVRDGTAGPSSYDCPDCEFALELELSRSTYWSTPVDSVWDSLGFDFEPPYVLPGTSLDGCDWLEAAAGEALTDPEGFTRDGIGFANEYSGYSDVAVYYFGAPYNAWYPIAYSYWDGDIWYYAYSPSSWYFYGYY